MILESEPYPIEPYGYIDVVRAWKEKTVLIANTPLAYSVGIIITDPLTFNAFVAQVTESTEHIPDGVWAMFPFRLTDLMPLHIAEKYAVHALSIHNRPGADREEMDVIEVHNDEAGKKRFPRLEASAAEKEAMKLKIEEIKRQCHKIPISILVEMQKLHFGSIT